ncbi:PspC domain-containing protein [Panacibacter sp. DH6]|uniref:PspC domain-containing protein n=1 Tax=Panacibacter microcysteis TaxID=2793269 RepID=A0A931E637_9BACT|nr:PspC domain-containing protein [Panacibacter microcysteis]MBG9376176.1 PspC domain-containing protein [Panacibacter microcysteis]
MKKVININFQGRVVPIEETAYDILKQYVESLRRFFANEEGKDEIINDIEGRIAELFGETLKKGGTCITDDDVNAIINSMGRPEEFETEEASVREQLGGQQYTNTGNASSSTSSSYQSYTDNTTTGSVRPERFYRDENNKLLGGVCAGLANYFNIDKLVVRILFVIFTFGFGFGFIAYLILWVAIPSSASTLIGSVRKRLFRDPDNKLIGGVCGGLASYFGVNVWVPRILFLIPFLSIVTSWNHWGMFDFPNFVNLSFSPGATLIYIILWLILPEALTTSDKLEMKGEKVDLNSIKNTIQKDMEGFGERAKAFGAEVGERAAELGSTIGARGKQFSAEAGGVAKKAGTTLGDIIVLIFKIFAYFILAVVLIAIVCSLFGIGIAFTGLLPLKGYIINDGWQNMLAWGAYIFFIWVPVIGIITWIIRRIAKIKSNSSVMRFSFAAMWILGWFCVIGLIASLRNDFSYHNNPVETNVPLSNPGVNKLELKLQKDTRYYFTDNFLHFEPFANIDEDTAFVQNIHIRVMKSETDSFHVTMLKMVNAATKAEADAKASRMEFSLAQKDTSLFFDRGIPISKQDKFRNQTIYITVYVPVGKRIYIKDNVGWSDRFHIQLGNDVDSWRWRYDEDGFHWDSNVDYTMTGDGLKRTYAEADDERNDDNNDDENRAPAEEYKDRVDTIRNKGTDSSRYRYQPAKEEQQKTEVKVTVEAPKTKSIMNINVHDLASTFIERTAI